MSIFFIQLLLLLLTQEVYTGRGRNCDYLKQDSTHSFFCSGILSHSPTSKPALAVFGGDSVGFQSPARTAQDRNIKYILCLLHLCQSLKCAPRARRRSQPPARLTAQCKGPSAGPGGEAAFVPPSPIQTHGRGEERNLGHPRTPVDADSITKFYAKTKLNTEPTNLYHSSKRNFLRVTKEAADVCLLLFKPWLCVDTANLYCKHSQQHGIVLV